MNHLARLFFGATSALGVLYVIKEIAQMLDSPLPASVTLPLAFVLSVLITWALSGYTRKDA